LILDGVSAMADRDDKYQQSPTDPWLIANGKIPLSPHREGVFDPPYFSGISVGLLKLIPYLSLTVLRFLAKTSSPLTADQYIMPSSVAGNDGSS